WSLVADRHIASVSLQCEEHVELLEVRNGNVGRVVVQRRCSHSDSRGANLTQELSNCDALKQDRLRIPRRLGPEGASSERLKHGTAKRDRVPITPRAHQTANRQNRPFVDGQLVGRPSRTCRKKAERSKRKRATRDSP